MRHLAPTNPFSWLSSLCLGVLSAMLAWAGLYLPPSASQGVSIYNDLFASQPAVASALEHESIPLWLTCFAWLALPMALLCLAAGCGAVVRHRFSLRAIRLAFGGVYLAFIAWQALLIKSLMTLGAIEGLVIANQSFAGEAGVGLWWSYTWWPGLVVLLAAVLHVVSHTRRTMAEYNAAESSAEEEFEPAPGDAILEDIRTFGPDPRYRLSVIASAFGHIFVIALLPILMDMASCSSQITTPASEDPESEVTVPVVRLSHQPRVLLLDPNSDIIFKRPELEKDSKVEQEVMTVSEAPYEADPERAHRDGKNGQGEGDGIGLPGEEVGILPFIRLEHRGPGWDDGMDGSARADQNFLAFFADAAKVKTARSGDSIRMAQLAHFDPGYAPPFVYLTGNGSIGVSSRDQAALRDYLQSGGMLLADAGSADFDHAFRTFIQSTLPGHRLVRIADDDLLFRVPYVFRNGAPPLWHHGGSHAMGIKVNGRWVVFYHPGDLNDAWKQPQFIDLPQHQTQGAYELGVNVVHYAIRNYLKENRKHRE